MSITQIIQEPKHPNSLKSGGDCESDGNGAVIQKNDQDEETRAVKSLRQSQKSGVAVGLIIGLSLSRVSLQIDLTNCHIN